MSNKRIKVDVSFIAPGMFVAQLDRPWLESPFSVHGFEIREEGQLHLLRKFCKHVYVDLAKSSLDKKKILAAHSNRSSDPLSKPVLRRKSSRKSSVGFLGGLASALGVGGANSHGETGMAYRTTTTLKKEVPAAIKAFAHATKQLNEILAQVRNNKGVSIDKLKGAVEPMVESILRNPDATSWLCYLPNRAHGGQCLTLASAAWAVIFGRYLGLDQYALNSLAMGGSLLDVGNANIPSSMVMCKEAPSEDEAEILRMHVDYGVKIVKSAPGVNDDILTMIACHHECHDGSGYPNRLEGDEIPLTGRIAALVNYFDTQISQMSYGTPRSTHGLICGLNALGGKLFQNELVQHFIQAIGMFPSGSLIGLNTGEVAMVIEQNRVHRLRPRVMVLTDRERKPLSSGKALDLTKVPDSGNKSKARWIVGGHPVGAFGLHPKQSYFE